MPLVLAANVAAVPWPCKAMAESHIVCPPFVDARQARVDAAAGWQGIFGPEGRLPLLGVQAISTPGSLRAPWGELKDPPTRKQGKAVIVTYPLPQEGDKWVVCQYGERVFQAMKLPGTIRKCSMTYRQGQLAGIACK